MPSSPTALFHRIRYVLEVAGREHDRGLTTDEVAKAIGYSADHTRRTLHAMGDEVRTNGATGWQARRWYLNRPDVNHGIQDQLRDAAG